MSVAIRLAGEAVTLEQTQRAGRAFPLHCIDSAQDASQGICEICCVPGAQGKASSLQVYL